MKKILLILLAFVLVSVFSILIYNKVSANSNKQYTQEDLDNAFEIGFETGLSTEQEYKDLIKELQLEVMAIQEDLTLSEEEKVAAITELNSQIEALNTRLKAYENAWDLAGKIMVTFYDGEEIYRIVLVDSGTSISSIEEPTKEYYSFNGWLANNEGEPIKDISTITINETINFYASYSVTASLSFEFVNQSLGDTSRGVGTVVVNNLSELIKYSDLKDLPLSDWNIGVSCVKTDEEFIGPLTGRLNTNNDVITLEFYNLVINADGYYKFFNFVLGEEYKMELVFFNISYPIRYSSDEVTFTYTGNDPTFKFNLVLR